MVIDVSHVALGKFPGIWDITSWPRYWAVQYAWLNGHQGWRASPMMVVRAWAASRFPGTTVVRQVNASTFTARVTGSSMANPYATISAAVGRPSGPLHDTVPAAMESTLTSSS